MCRSGYQKPDQTAQRVYNLIIELKAGTAHLKVEAEDPFYPDDVIIFFVIFEIFFQHT